MNLAIHLDRGGFWLRLPGSFSQKHMRLDAWDGVRGVSVRWDRPPMLFSERSGSRRCWRLGPIRVEALS